MARTGIPVQITHSPTFCSAPWTSLNIDQTGRVMPCMHSVYELGNIKHTPIQQILLDGKIKNLKQTIARGQWHEACVMCKRLEDTTGASGRTGRLVDQETLTAIDNDLDFFKLQHLVVNWSNLCNLACVYCNNETSTAWQSINKIPIDHAKNEHQDLIELVKTQGHDIQGLSLGGGEPLLQKGLVEFLDYLDPLKVRVMVTTNLSMDINTNSVYQKLKDWPQVTWMISFDNANKDKFEYVRHNAKWEQFVKNIRQMKADGEQVKAHPAYSIYCAWDLMEYYDFCAAENLEIYWCELNHPVALDVRRQSLPVRQRAIEEIDQVVAKYSTQPNLSTDALNRYRMTLKNPSYINNTYDKFKSQDTVVWISMIEAKLKKTQTFQDLWPKLQKMIASC
jgi:radical SAM protein with 4Fe4S-binding SPASM domain